MSVLERRWQNGAEGEHTGCLETLAPQVADSSYLRDETGGRRRERLKQLLELDRDVHLPQIIALGKKIDELIQVGLAKTTTTLEFKVFSDMKYRLPFVAFDCCFFDRRKWHFVRWHDWS